MLQKSLIEFQFEFTDCNGRMRLFENDREILPGDDGLAVIQRSIQWPSTVEFKSIGKDVSGTLLDNHGNIVKDRAIKINHLKVDNLIPDINFLSRWPVLIVDGGRSNQVINSNYFGFNGLIRFNFSANSAIHFMIRTNQFRDNFWNSN